MTSIRLDSPDLREALLKLRAGDRVSLSGPVYTARDAAHKRLFELLDAGEELPIDIRGAVVYYAGPTPAPPGRPIGSCGPTTSSRMDVFTPRLLELGLAAMIGKGERSRDVNEAIRRCGAVYFCALGGAGALISRHVVSAREVAFPDLGCESIKELILDGLPLTVGTDSLGNSIFKEN
ncbi:MAG: fumarate hydratase C-terminal domain-containing protein [Oscillospiraceae bacterium]|nr:fumarate hydratase C-terminal domain-containing protein [Oscillospiraceae bacterium]